MNITIYITPACPYCLQAKNYFEEKKLPFEEIDVGANKKAAEEMVKLSGQMGVPVIKIDKEMIIGFDKEKIESVLSG